MKRKEVVAMAMRERTKKKKPLTLKWLHARMVEGFGLWNSSMRLQSDRTDIISKAVTDLAGRVEALARHSQNENKDSQSEKGAPPPSAPPIIHDACCRCAKCEEAYRAALSHELDVKILYLKLQAKAIRADFRAAYEETDRRLAKIIYEFAKSK